MNRLRAIENRRYFNADEAIFDGSFVNASATKGLANQSISWIEAKTFDIGFDLEAWDGLLGLTVDYFRRDRDGLLTTRAASLPGVVGARALHPAGRVW